MFRNVRFRVPMLLAAGASLLAGLAAGLLRMYGLQWPLVAHWAETHGALMVSGFVGTLICLERAVALRKGWGMTAPILAGLGSLAWVGGFPYAAAVGSGAASVALTLIYAAMYRLQPALHTAVMGAGAVCWAGGIYLTVATRGSLDIVIPWWVGFLVLTIVGERLELNRVRFLSPAAQNSLVAVIGLFAAGILLTLYRVDIGWRVAGLALFLQGGWLLRFDVARHTLGQAGLTRFIALALRFGFGWLAGAGALWLVFGAPGGGGVVFDAMIHMVLLGFVMSMIFGHAPVIFPAVLGLNMGFHNVFYAHLLLLHGSLILRILGDLTVQADWVRWGGTANVLSVLLFGFLTVRSLKVAAPAR